jgi:hypothetical protein
MYRGYEQILIGGTDRRVLSGRESEYAASQLCGDISQDAGRASRANGTQFATCVYSDCDERRDAPFLMFAPDFTGGL